MKKLSLVILILLVCAFFIQVASANIVTETPFNISFTSGESFIVQDEYRGNYVFNVESGSLTGTATLNLDSSIGTFVINSGSAVSLTITDYSPTSTVYLDGTPYVSGNVFSLSAGQTITITWKETSVIIIGSGDIMHLYFRSDSKTTLGTTAYGMDTDFTNIAATETTTASGAVSISYGYRVWLYSSGASTELTGGSPEATITLSAPTTGIQTSQFTFGGHSVVMGYQALKVIVYVREGSGSWVASNTFVSNVLLTKYLQPAVWDFRLSVNYANPGGDTVCSYSFGNSDYKSGLFNVVFTAPLESELNAWRLAHGDVIGFIFGSYVDIMGEAFYALILLAIAGSMYRRYGHFGPIAFFFVVFGGVGGIIWLFVPLWAALVVATFVIVGVTFIVWRLIR